MNLQQKHQADARLIADYQNAKDYSYRKLAEANKAKIELPEKLCAGYIARKFQEARDADEMVNVRLKAMQASMM